VPKLIKDKSLLPNAFSFLKVTESLTVMFFTWLAGYLRHETGAFQAVTCMLIFTSLVAMVATYAMMNELQSYPLGKSTATVSTEKVGPDSKGVHNSYATMLQRVSLFFD
jgi:high-affinity Fe2+/Pb2+ permease